MAGSPWGAVGSNLPSAQQAQGGSGGSSYGQIGEDPVQVAQNGVQKYLGMIGASGNQAAVNQANNVATHNAGGGWFHDILSALDVPRAAVVSGIDQGFHGLDHLLGDAKPGEANASFSGWLQGVKNHETTGHILAEAGMPSWLRSVGGVVGDVAFDPLTYLGGAGEIGRGLAVAGHVTDAVNAAHKAEQTALEAQRAGEALQAGAKGVTAESHQALQQAAADAAAKAKDLTGGVITPDTMTRLQTRGVAGLTQAERDVIGEATGINMKTGLGLRAPFSAGRSTATLVPGALTDGVQGAAHEAVQRLADRQFMRNLGEKLIPNGAVKNLTRAAALAGDGTAAAAIKGAVDRIPQAEGVARQTYNEFGQQAADALKGLPDEAVQHLPAAMEGSPEALAAFEQAGGNADAIRNVLGGIRQRAVEAGLPVGNIENYWPHQLTAEARDAMTKAGGNFQTAKKVFTDSLESRGLTPGSEFLGHTLEHGTVDEINQIAHEVYGKDAFDVFATNPRQVLNNYLHGMSRAIGQKHFANALDGAGITASGDMAMTPEEWQSLMRRAGRQQGGLQKALAQIAAGHGEAAQSLGEAPNAANEARASLGGSDVSLSPLGRHFEGSVASQDVHDALAKLAEIQHAPKTPNKVLDFYDKALNVWKQYALASPGKAVRHTVAGPAWGSFIGNVSLPQIRKGMAAWRAIQAGKRDISAVDRKFSQEFMDQGLQHGHDFHAQDLVNPNSKMRYNPLSTKHGYFRKNQELQREGQDYWRYAMYRDARQRGYTAEAAAQKVRMFLGDPHNITQFERSSARRLVPFYTFLRQNIPTELRALSTEPNKFVNSVQTAQNEFSAPTGGTPIPQLFKQTGAIPLPWHVGGSQVFVSPDLPFSRFSEMTSGLNQIESQTSPLLQAAIEAINNVNTYTNVPFSPYGKQMPSADVPAVLGPVLHQLFPNDVYQTKQTATSYGQTVPKGQWQITPKAATILGNFLPMLSQVQGLDTAGNPSQAGRGTTNLLDQAIGGAVLRTNTPQQQAGELYRRQAVLKSMIEQLQNRGQLPKYIYGFHP